MGFFGSGEVAVLQRTTLITDAQIKALPTTAIELVPSPGPNKIIQPFGAYVSINRDAGDYGNVDPDGRLVIGAENQDADLFNIAINSVAQSLTQLDGFLTGSPSQMSGFASAPAQFTNASFGVLPNFFGTANIVNHGIFIWADNVLLGNFTEGNAANSLIVSVLYAIIDV